MESQELKDRSKAFAVTIIKFVDLLPKKELAFIIKRQIIRSSTSVASNYRAACRARSKSEFFAKLCIVVEEADETLFWLEIIEEADLFKGEKLFELKKEALELLKIFSASKKTSNPGSFNVK